MSRNCGQIQKVLKRDIKNSFNPSQGLSADSLEIREFDEAFQLLPLKIGCVLALKWNITLEIIGNLQYFEPKYLHFSSQCVFYQRQPNRLRLLFCFCVFFCLVRSLLLSHQGPPLLDRSTRLRSSSQRNKRSPFDFYHHVSNHASLLPIVSHSTVQQQGQGLRSLEQNWIEIQKPLSYSRCCMYLTVTYYNLGKTLVVHIVFVGPACSP